MEAQRFSARYRDPARWAEAAAERTNEAMTRLFAEAYGPAESERIAVPEIVVRAG